MKIRLLLLKTIIDFIESYFIFMWIRLNNRESYLKKMPSRLNNDPSDLYESWKIIISICKFSWSLSFQLHPVSQLQRWQTFINPINLNVIILMNILIIDWYKYESLCVSWIWRLCLIAYWLTSYRYYFIVLMQFCICLVVDHSSFFIGQFISLCQ